MSNLICKVRLLIALIAMSFSVNAQAPNLLNYQGVARNAVGNPLPNQAMNLRLSVHNFSADGTVVYTETRVIKTNLGGLFSVQIGSTGATSITGTISGVNWLSGDKFLQVEIDPTSNNSYLSLGTVQLVSVPYAINASSAGTAINLSGIVSIANGGTGATSAVAAKTSLVLGNVDNTSDLLKPISTATQTSLDTKATTTSVELKENISNKSTDIKLGNSDDLYPTQNAVKAYIAANTTSVGLADGSITNAKIASGISADKVGLGNVNNTSDLLKPISTATQTSLDTKATTASVSLKENISNKSTDVNLGNSDDLYPTQKAVKNYIAANTSSVGVGDGSITNAKIASGISAAKVGLGNVDNTSDLLKPISTATQTSLDTKENTSNKSAAIDLGGISPSDILFPTQKAVQNYIANTSFSGSIADGGITNLKLADLSVTNAKINDVNGSKVAGDIGGNAANVTGIVAVANGGTGAINASGARTNLGLTIGTDVQSPLSFNAPLNKNASTISLSQASTSVDGYLSLSDWTTFNNKIDATQKAANNGVATLGNDGKIPSNQIPSVSFQSANVVTNQANMLALSAAVVGSIAIRTDVNKNFVLSALPSTTLVNWIELASPNSVTSVNTSTGPNVVLTTANISEGTNLYYTDARARTAMSASSPLSYSASTGLISLPAASASVNGYLNASDFTIFNNKQTTLTFGTGLTNTSSTVSVNSSQNIATLSNLTSNGIVTTSGAAGTLSIVSTLPVLNGGTGATTLTGIVKGNGTSALSAAVAGTDYLAPTGSAANLTSFPTFNQSTTGNAGTATLAGNITATTNSTLTTLSSLTSVGTITSGIWSGTSIAVAKGGTGLTAPGTSGNVLTSNGSTWTSAPASTVAAAGTLTGTTLASNVVNSSLTSVGTIVTGVWSGTAITAGTLTGTTLAANVVSSSLTSVGTITTGVWSGTAVAVTKGGTGLTSTPTNGQIDIGNGTGFTRTTLTAGTGISIATGAGTITITSSTSALPTGTTFGDMLYWDGSAWIKLAAGSNGQILVFDNTPKWGILAGATVDPQNVISATEVVTATGRTWMDRNLGALRAATSITDQLAYGSLYQWGRLSDGHQEITWTNSSLGNAVNGTSPTASSGDRPGHAFFIEIADDWRSSKNDNLWQGTGGTNNPCPSGYRIPTASEFLAEIYYFANANQAFSSALKLTMPGHRAGGVGGVFNGTGVHGFYWTSTLASALGEAKSLHIDNTSATTPTNYQSLISSNQRGLGISVRCIKN